MTTPPPPQRNVKKKRENEPPKKRQNIFPLDPNNVFFNIVLRGVRGGRADKIKFRKAEYNMADDDTAVGFFFLKKLHT